jgi:hypothetical protein
MEAKKFFRKFGWIFSLMAAATLSTPLFAGETVQMVEQETGIYYTIQKGDTLWDLSRRFDNSPWQWPDLWEENKQIANPHWIYPGERIRLYRKKDLETIVKKDAAGIGKKDAAPVGKEEPKKEAPFFFYPGINAVGFVRVAPLKDSGEIVKVQDDHEMIGTGETVYIRPNPDAAPFSPGERYTVYRTRAWVGDAQNRLGGYGSQYYLTGIVEIRRIEAELVAATVAKAYREIHIGDLLIPYEPQSPKITLVETPGGVTGKIFMAEEHQDLIGTGHVVFIDKGEADGVKPGQIYRVYSQDSESLNPKMLKAKIEDQPFASLMVLHAEDTTATCVVIKALRNIQAGAVFAK